MDATSLLKTAYDASTELGKLSLIISENEGRRFIEIASAMGWSLNRITSVIPRKGSPVERLMIELQKNRLSELCVENVLIIHEKGQHNYTAEYINLTKEFYLSM